MLKIDLKGKIVFIAGIADDQSYGWAIAKSLAEAGATLLIGTWTPLLKIFSNQLAQGKFDESRRLEDGTLMQFAKIYPLDASFDTSEEIPEDVLSNKRYKDCQGYSVSEVANAIKADFGSIDFLVHSLANAPEVSKPLLETSRSGYLAAMSASTYSFISLLKHFGPLMNPQGAALTLSYIAAERVIPGYGGGMSSAKAALESDTRTLAWEAGRKWNVRVNAISAGAMKTRAAKAIGKKELAKTFIELIIDYTAANAPLQEEMCTKQVGDAAAFLLSPLASAITGTILYVDNGIHAMGLATDSKTLN